VLLISRAVYAFSWYNVGAVLPFIGTDLHASTVGVGIVLGAFLIGAGAFQIPAGIAAVRWGNRPISLAALAIMGAFALASAFSPNWYVLAALRFGVGAGAAFFFAPALGLISSYYPVGTRGPIFGAYNAGFSGGSAAGLIFGAALGAALGWPWALGIGGVALLGVTAFGVVFLPEGNARPPTVRTADALRIAAPLLRSRVLWALALGTTGLWAASYILAQYFVYFAAAAHSGWSLTLAAALPTGMILVEIVGGPVGGWIGERHSDMRWVLVIFGIPAAVLVALVPFLPFAALIGVFLVFGFAIGVVYAVLYLLPSYLPGLESETLSLGLGLLNGIQIFAGSGLAILFGFVAAGPGYDVAWILTAAVGVGMLPLLLGVPHVRGAPPGGTAR
jgi:MFS family permease